MKDKVLCSFPILVSWRYTRFLDLALLLCSSTNQPAEYNSTGLFIILHGYVAFDLSVGCELLVCSVVVASSFMVFMLYFGSKQCSRRKFFVISKVQQQKTRNKRVLNSKKSQYLQVWYFTNLVCQIMWIMLLKSEIALWRFIYLKTHVWSQVFLSFIIY